MNGTENTITSFVSFTGQGNISDKDTLEDTDVKRSALLGWFKGEWSHSPVPTVIRPCSCHRYDKSGFSPLKYLSQVI